MLSRIHSPSRVCLPFLALSLAFQVACTRRAEVADSGAEVVDWREDAAIARLERSRHKVDFFALANQFESQTDKIICGPTTATIVLNALRLEKPVAKPVDESYPQKPLRKHLPEGFDARVARYTPNTFFNEKSTSIKTKEKVYGEPIEGNKDFGLQLRQFHQMLEAHGLKSEIFVVDDAMTEDQIRDRMIENLGRRGDFVLVNFKRGELKQEGGGHISPVGAYDKETDSFLVLDVNPSRTPWFWVKTSALVRAMRTFDTVENRGFLLVSEGTIPHDGAEPTAAK